MWTTVIIVMIMCIPRTTVKTTKTTNIDNKSRYIFIAIGKYVIIAFCGTCYKCTRKGHKTHQCPMSNDNNNSTIGKNNYNNKASRMKDFNEWCETRCKIRIGSSSSTTKSSSSGITNNSDSSISSGISSGVYSSN